MQNLNFKEHGIEIKPDLVSGDLIHSIISEVSTSGESMQKHGIRNAEKKFASISNIVYSSEIVEEEVYAERSIQNDCPKKDTVIPAVF